jgi:RNA polymerase sigma-70 factor (ECF subfamily)
LRPHRLQAEIAAVHARAPEASATDWGEIARLYRRLLSLTDSPVVALNHAVAVALAEGPAAGLALVNELDRSGRLDGYHLVAATQADLLRRLGRVPEARYAYRRALAGARSPAEQDFLRNRLDQLVTRGTEPVAEGALGTEGPGRAPSPYR